MIHLLPIVIMAESLVAAIVYATQCKRHANHTRPDGAKTCSEVARAELARAESP